MASGDRGAMARTMASMIAGSDRKCWPNRLRATCFTCASARRVAVVDERPAPDVLDPRRVGLVDLLFAQRVAGHLAQLRARGLGLAALHHLDQVHAVTRNHGVGDL